MLYWLGRFYLWLTGFTMVGTPPDLPKYEIIAAPHTSNWDVPLMLSITWVGGIRVRWTIKDEWFRWPFGWFIRALGGLPIDRGSRRNVVEQLIDAFNRSERLILLITPEATRSRSAYWKSGFYHVATGAGVPIMLIMLDYEKRTAGYGPVITASGDMEHDMEIIRRHVEQQRAKYPACVGPVRMKPRADRLPTPDAGQPHGA